VAIGCPKKTAKAKMDDRKRALTAMGNCRVFPAVVCGIGGGGKIQVIFSASLETRSWFSESDAASGSERATAS